jgi:hypothetical protein
LTAVAASRLRRPALAARRMHPLNLLLIPGYFDIALRDFGVSP